jgi:hypothetical protein
MEKVMSNEIKPGLLLRRFAKAGEVPVLAITCELDAGGLIVSVNVKPIDGADARAVSLVAYALGLTKDTGEGDPPPASLASLAALLRRVPGLVRTAGELSALITNMEPPRDRGADRPNWAAGFRAAMDFIGQSEAAGVLRERLAEIVPHVPAIPRELLAVEKGVR